MGLHSTFKRTTNFLKGFRKERSGGVAMMTGLVFPILFVGIGGAVDYSQTVAAKQKAQRAMDSAVLALTRRDLSNIDIQTEGRELFASHLQERQLMGDLESIEFTLSDTLISGSAVIDHPTAFLGFIGMDELMARVEASAIPPENNPIEIALVLDVSTSMNSDLNGLPRIDYVKEAVNDMFDTLDDTLPADADLRASLVPYSTSVNISNYPTAAMATSVSNLPQEPEIWAAERFVSATGDDFFLNDASPAISPVPFITESELQSGRTETPMKALTDNIAEIRTAVAAMVPSGRTAGHIGMAWGLYSISESWSNFWPSAPGAADDTNKIIVFLSDGKFNQTHNIGAASKTDTSTSNAYFQDMCTLARDSGYTIYTVALALDPTSEAILSECVGTSGEAYTADSAEELTRAFEDIARLLGSHRLTS